MYKKLLNSSGKATSLLHCNTGAAQICLYLGHGARSKEVCSDFNFIQVDLLQHHTSLLLLRCQLFHLLDVDIFVGYDALIDLAEVATS